MRKFLLFCMFAIISDAAFSQMNGAYNYSVAINAYSMMQMPQILNQKHEDQLRNASFTGGMFKFNDKQISYRLSGSYLAKDKLRLINDCEGCEEANGKMTDYSFKVGFEKAINFSTIQPYFGFDIGFRQNKFNGTLTSTNPLQAAKSAADMTAMPYKTAEAIKSGFVAAPLIGLKINVIPQLSLFAEGNLQLYYAYSRTETIAQDLDNTRDFRKTYKAEYLLNPVTVGIQFHLGNSR